MQRARTPATTRPADVGRAGDARRRKPRRRPATAYGTLTVSGSLSTPERVTLMQPPNGNYDLYITDVRTGKDRRLTRTPRAELQPAWSPDGALIAFTAAPGTDVYNEIYLISPPGGSPRVLTTGLGTNSNSAPAWSPDGSTIIFESEVFLGHDADLWTVPRNGGPAVRYTSFEWNERTPSW